MPAANQIDTMHTAPLVRAADLLTVPDGDITEGGLKLNIDVGIRYLASWMTGNGCVPIYGLMEDAATAEISRAQLWQWVRHAAHTKEGGVIDAARVNAVIASQLEAMKREFGGPAFDAGRFEEAGRLFGNNGDRLRIRGLPDARSI